MELVPVVIISKQQGIPIPSNNFTFTLSKEDFEKFITTEVDIRGAPLKDTFLISVSEEDTLALNLLLNPQEKLESTAVIGVFCQLVDVDIGPFESRIICKILTRAKIDKYVQAPDGIQAPLQIIRERLLPGEEELLNDLRVLVDHLIQNESTIPEEIKKRVTSSKDIIKISNILAGSLKLSPEDKFLYLQYKDNLDRFTIVLRHLVRLLDKNPNGDQIKTFNLDGMDSNAQAVFLENMLPQGFTSLLNDMQQLARKQQANEEENIDPKQEENFPPEIAKKVEKERKRLRSLNPASMEHQTVQEYLDWITSIPWGKSTYSRPELTSFIDILNHSHYGLDDIKEHLLEYMCIEDITNASKGTVLCFAGPPGTGKTSIAKQIAKATNRKIVKIALGGMSDEAEIRGHRRTYVAAKPGRITTGLINAGVMDPLFLLDEVDKTASYYKGDPVSALLELLDPEQNNEFIDRFVESPIDLSKAMFICTANYIDDIPAPLRDRLEIIKFREYTEEEKLVIAKDYILPRVKADYMIQDMNIKFDDKIFKTICEGYGVRDIERRVRKLLRQAAVKIRVHQKEEAEITEAGVTETFKDLEEGKQIGF